jgi:hypothetical protein
MTIASRHRLSAVVRRISDRLTPDNPDSRQPQPKPQSRQPKHESRSDMADTTFDLGVNTSVPLTVVATDAAGNVVAGVNPVWTESDALNVAAAALIALAGQGDGSTVAYRLVASSAGSVTVTATVTNADGTTAIANLALTLSAQGGGTGAGVTGLTIVPGVPTA